MKSAKVKTNSSWVPVAVLGRIYDRIFRKTEYTSRNAAQQDADRRVKEVGCLPYVHCFWHTLKKIASKYGVDVVFSALNKLRVCAGVCAAVQQKLDKDGTRGSCTVHHVTLFTTCHKAAVYDIPI